MEQFKFGVQQPHPIAQALRQAPAQGGGGPLGRGRVYTQSSPISGSGTQSSNGASDADWGEIMKNGQRLFSSPPTGTMEVGAAPGSASNPFSAMQGSSAFGGAGGSSAGAGSSMMSTAGPIAGAVLGGLATDNLLNESDKDKWYNADKINSYGTVNMGGKDIGLRGGDFINGINPATWLSDPKKASTGLLNAFTLGIFD